MKTSIITVIKNEEKHVRKCIDAILRQTRSEFELIVLDNGSKDGTAAIVNSFKDPRIRYIYEPQEVGIAKLRNIGIKRSSGDYVFFTDGDCIPSKYWLEEGMLTFEKTDAVGVEGKTLYESPAKVTVSDQDTFQYGPGEFMTCNVAYRRDALDKVKYFDSHFRRGSEDRDLALRIQEIGNIAFSSDMLVVHQTKKLTPRGVMEKAKRAEDRVYLIKKHGWAGNFKCGPKPRFNMKVLELEKLILILCPPLMILNERYASFNDIIVGITKYFSYIYERYLIWKSAIKYRIFVI